MSAQGRKLLIASGIAIVALTVSILVAVRSQPVEYPNSPQTLPDGSVLTLVKVDYGKTNTLIDGTRFQQFVSRFMPKGSTNFLGFTIPPQKVAGTTVSPADELVFWLQRTITPSALASQPKSRFPWGYQWTENRRVVAFDEHGNEFGNILGGPISGTGTNYFIPVQIRAFPRDGKMVGIRIFERSGVNSMDWKQVAEFKTANPAPGPFPRWHSQPLPDDCKIGNLDFSLISLKVAPSNPGSWSANSGMFSTSFEFRVTEDGRPSPSWTPMSVWMSEANGNYQRTSIDKGIYGYARVPYSLNPAMPWKMSVEFCRTYDYPPEELWNMTNIPVTTGSFTASTNILGTPVKVSLNSGGIMEFELPARPKNQRLAIVNATGNPRGQTIHVSSSSFSQHQAFISTMFGANVQTMDVTIAVTRSVTADFLAQPRLVMPTNGPAASAGR